MSLIYETTHFSIEAPSGPHVTRTDGGHIVIFPKEPVVHRWDFDADRAKALMRLSSLAGEAMYGALNERGIPIERINFQDNGNWSIGSEHGPKFHLHLYGRARGSAHQTHGEALYIPPKASRFWEALEPLDEGDRQTLREHLERLAEKPRYRLETWGLTDA